MRDLINKLQQISESGEVITLVTQDYRQEGYHDRGFAHVYTYDGKEMGGTNNADPGQIVEIAAGDPDMDKVGQAYDGKKAKVLDVDADWVEYGPHEYFVRIYKLELLNIDSNIDDFMLDNPFESLEEGHFSELDIQHQEEAMRWIKRNRQGEMNPEEAKRLGRESFQAAKRGEISKEAADHVFKMVRKEYEEMEPLFPKDFDDGEWAGQYGMKHGKIVGRRGNMDYYVSDKDFPTEGLEEGFGYSYDDFVQEMKHSLMHKIVSYGVFEEMIKAAGGPKELEDAITDEAYSVADSYHDTGEGIGTSDMNHFVQSIGRSLGIEDVLGWNLKKESIEEDYHQIPREKIEKFADLAYNIKGGFLSRLLLKGRGLSREAAEKKLVNHGFSVSEIQELGSWLKKAIENVAGEENILMQPSEDNFGGWSHVTWSDDESGMKGIGLDLESEKEFNRKVMDEFKKLAWVQPGVMKSDDEMERDAVNRYNKYNTAIRNRFSQARANRPSRLGEDAGHSIFDILADSDVYHLVDDLEYGRFDNNSSYADILYDYYNDEMPYDVATGDYGEPDEWIKDKLMQDYGDEIDAIAAKMADEQLAAIRKNAGLSEDETLEEKVVKVPRGLRGEEGNPLGLTSQDAEDFINSLGPDDVVSTDVVDPETGELLDWPDRGTRRELGKKQYKRDELERKEREEQEHEEGFDSPYLYVPNIKADPERAWDGIQTMKYDREFTDFYNIVWRSVRDIAGVPGDFGTANDEEWADLDYDVDVDVPVAIKRKDGKKFNKQDRKNFDEISKIFKAAMGNIGLHYIGSSDNGTVARFTPTFM